MKTKNLLTLLMLAVAGMLAAQTGEFATSGNGLIYSDNAVKELKHIVDSLNLKFRTCENKTYYSTLQGRGRFFRLEGRKAKEALQDMKAGQPFAEMARKYPGAETGEELVVRYEYTDYRDIDVVSFDPVSLSGDEGYGISYEGKEAHAMKGAVKGWVYEFTPKSDYSNKDVVAGYYFDKNMVSDPLNEHYSRLVQYSECLVDTTAQVYFDNAKDSGVRFSDETRGQKMYAFLEYIDEKLEKPQFSYSEEMPDDMIGSDTTAVDTVSYDFDDVRYEVFYKQRAAWDSLRPQRVDSLMQHNPVTAKLYKEALEEAISNPGATSDEFEEYVSRYTSRQQALYFKRSRRVIGGCSMDNSPRLHAMEIAELAAETASWEIFLRSHLDIMNDRFERVSDGSYAWEGRQTYIKELEVLDINVPDLLLGITLRIENPSENHYFGSIRRMGRSLAESKDKAVIEKMMLDMVADNELDDYNRVLAFWLFRNYNVYLENKEESRQNIEKLRQAVAAMPAYLTAKANFEE